MSKLLANPFRKVKTVGRKTKGIVDSLDEYDTWGFTSKERIIICEALKTFDTDTLKKYCKCGGSVDNPCPVYKVILLDEKLNGGKYALGISIRGQAKGTKQRRNHV